MATTLTNDTYRREYTKDFVGYWDELIGWEGREKAEAGFFQRLLAAHNCRTVIDVACGTGFHSIMLARDGFEVTATDGSENMIHRTLANAQDRKVRLAAAHCVDWLHLREKLGENRFDALLCLGNAFTHLFDHEARREALAAMYAVVKPGGLVVIDQRNYDSMLANGFSSRHRYYYTGRGVHAEPVELSRTRARFRYAFPDGAVFHLTMYPLKQDYLTHLLEDAGFVDVTRYGDFQRPYSLDEVDFIQQVAFKPRV